MDFDSLISLHMNASTAGNPSSLSAGANTMGQSNDGGNDWYAISVDAEGNEESMQDEDAFTIEQRLGGALNASREDNDNMQMRGRHHHHRGRGRGRHTGDRHQQNRHHNQAQSSRGSTRNVNRFGPGCGRGSAVELIPGTIELAEVWGDYPGIVWRDHWHTADPGSMLIHFECKADDNIVVCLSTMRGIPDDKITYEIVLGGWKNTKVSE